MKIRERIGKMWRKKSFRYGAAGTLCLMLAAAVLALSFGTGARAESITLGTTTLDFNKDGTGAYLIDNESQIRALRQATPEQTSSAENSPYTFKLTQDIPLGDVTDAATGTFAGIFDGNGYVIKIGNITISDATAQTSQGVLFGTVTGTVQNLIVDIQGTASYIRTSGASYNDGNNQVSVAVSGTSATATGETYGEFNTMSGGAKETLANTLASDTNSFNVGGNIYKREAIPEGATQTTKYAANDLTDESFGAICGTLGSSGNISQVYVKGTSGLSVTRNEASVKTGETATGKRDKYFYYKETSTEISRNKDLDVTAPNVEVYQQGQVSGSNPDWSIVSIEVKADKYVKSGNVQTYTVTVKSNNTDSKKAIVLNSITAVESNYSGGSWKRMTSEGEKPKSGNSWNVTLNNGDTETFTYEVTAPNVSGTMAVSFKANYTVTTTSTENATKDSSGTVVTFTTSSGTLSEDGNSYVYSVDVVANREVTDFSISPDGITGGVWSPSLPTTPLTAGEKEYTYTIDKNVVGAGNVTFTAEYTKKESDDSYVTSSQVSSTVYSSTSTTGTPKIDNPFGIQGTLSADKNTCMVGETVTYTLELKPNGTLQDSTVLKITDPSAGSIIWKDTNGNPVPEEGIVVEASGITLKATVSAAVAGTKPLDSVSVPVTKVFKQVKSYTYEGTGSGIGLSGTDVDYGSFVQNPGEGSSSDIMENKGNNLYAGGLVGINSGTITEAKQELNITSTDAASTNGSSLKAGGIAGKNQGGTMSSMYMLGKTGDSSVYIGDDPTTTPAYSLSASSDTAPGNGWTTYQKYNTGTKNLITSAELSWLVKKEQNGELFGYDSNNLAATKSVSYTAAAEGRACTYVFGYNARKALTETSEDKKYVVATNTLDLGDSGYYRLLSKYATDGYYHYYSEPVPLERAEYVYPYESDTTSNPYVLKTGTDGQKIVRDPDPNTVTDMLQLTFKKAGTATSVIHYTNAWRSELPTGSDPTVNFTSDTVNLFFEEERIQYSLVPVVDGHIYPSLTTDEFDKTDRAPLPAPVVSHQDGYQADGTEKPYQTMAAGTSGTVSCEAGSLLRIASADTTNEYTYKYLFTEAQLESFGEDERYTGSDVNTLMSGAMTYSGTASVPSVPGDYYLYVQISRNNYRDEVYAYGKIEVMDKISSSVTLYYMQDEHASFGSGSGMIVSGDLMKLSGNNGYSIWYLTSDTKMTDFSSVVNDWNSYDGSPYIPLTGTAGSQIYIYVRQQKSETYYSEIQEYGYTFADACAQVRISPNTGLASTGGEEFATEQEAGTTAYLSCRTDNAIILYTMEKPSETITLERVAALPQNAADGETSGSYKYFKAGSRWYRTTNLTLQKYMPDSSKILLTNSEPSPKYQYVYAVALADGYEPSTVRDYVYKVNPPKQVETPQANLVTRYAPGGDSVEIAGVERGASISFSSVTPGVTFWYQNTGSSEWIQVPENGIKVEGAYNTRYTVKVKACKDGMLDSDEISFTYLILEQAKTDAPTATPSTSAEAPTVVLPGNKILLSTATSGATIYYTTDGSSPVLTENADGSYTKGEGTLIYDSATGITMPEDGSGYFVITAVAAKTNLAKSDEVHLTYAYPEAVSEPYGSVDPGKVTLNTEVSLKSRTKGATIYYTVAYGDQVPEAPTVSSPVFAEEHPFVITQKTTIKAMAVKDGVKSEVVTLVYDPMAQLAAPTPSVESGSVISRGTVLTLKAASGATVYYTTDGSDPKAFW